LIGALASKTGQVRAALIAFSSFAKGSAELVSSKLVGIWLIKESSGGFAMNNYPLADADATLNLLREGNESYRNKGRFHQVDRERRNELQSGQSPMAAVLCCSDSRVPPEILFDRRLGDLFVIRNAGNVIDDVVLGSIEYAVAYLGVQLIVVLGHEKCGAVTATVQNAPAQGHLASIMSRIRPAVEKVRAYPGDTVALAVDAHILEGLAALRRKPEFVERLEQQQLKVVGMRYNLEAGTLTDIV
jgi:carbonic anhydrase